MVNVTYAHFLSSLSAACVSGFKIRPEKQVLGAKVEPNADTLIKCKHACLVKDSCAGFDFSETGCYMHTSANVNRITDNPNVDNYLRVESCKRPARMYS